MLYTQNIENCFLSNNIKAQFVTNREKALKSKQNFYNYQNGKAKYIIDAATNPNDIKEIKDIEKYFSNNFSNLLVLGTGGSTLNPQSLVALGKRPDNIYFIDNIDPFFITSILNKINLEKTLCLVISKSGSTLEVLVQFTAILSAYEEIGIKDIGRHFLIITDPIESQIKAIALDIGAKILDHPANIGGRFSTFTNVALLPALISGFNIEEFLKGATKTANNFLSNDNSLPLEGAALAITAMQNSLNINVFMPYIEALKPFSNWVCQIWAESIGKEGYGSTPVKAIGTLDQHSQLQLYLDGPQDKLLNIIDIKNYPLTPKINQHVLSKYNLSLLQGKNIGEINKACRQGTYQALIDSNKPTRLIELEHLNEECLGALMMHFIIETILSAQILGINAFDQPAVENGKIIAKKLLGS